jgi:hypothetical protein
MGPSIKPPFLNRSENQCVVFDTAAWRDNAVIWRRFGPAQRPPARKTRPGRVELSGRYAIVSRAGADFMSFAAPAFLVEKATNG